MSFKVNEHCKGVGESFRFRFGPVFSQPARGASCLESEIELVRKCLHHEGGRPLDFDTAIFASALPKVHRALPGATYASASGLTAGRVVELSGSCAVLLSALHYCFTTRDETETVALITVDSFASSYYASSKGEPWRDGCGVLLVENDGPLEITLRSYASAADFSLLSGAHRVGGELEVPFSPSGVPGFSVVEDRILPLVIEAAVRQAGLGFSEIEAVILVNRAEVYPCLGRIPLSSECLISHTRGDFGHAGSSDLLNNFKVACEAGIKGNLIFVAVGLGYVWQAMVCSLS